MSRVTFSFQFSDLNLSVQQIENVIGYRDGESHETISEIIYKILKVAASEAQIKGEYQIFPDVIFNEKERSVKIINLDFNINKIVYSQLKRCETIAIFLCTAGEEIGNRSRSAMKEGDLLTGYIYDIIGSEVVEAATDLMQNSLRELLVSEGKKITNRYSPGYCGWNVSEQHKLFELMPDNFCGIRLTSSALMDPIKSVSGFIGIGEHVKYNPYTCRLCEIKDCIYRRLRS